MNDTQNTCLHLACIAGDINSVKELIEAGADLFAKNKDKETPL